jgi:hypothetical protein
MTGQDTIVSSVLALLAAALPGDVLVGESVDFDSLPDGTERAVEVTLLASTPTQPYAGYTAPREWTNRLRITCAARNDGRVSGQGRPSQNLLALVDAAIVTTPDLGGLLQEPLQLADTRPDQQRSDTRLGVVDALYTCKHQTAWNSLLLVLP